MLRAVTENDDSESFMLQGMLALEPIRFLICVKIVILASGRRSYFAQSIDFIESEVHYPEVKNLFLKTTLLLRDLDFLAVRGVGNGLRAFTLFR